MAFFLAVAAGNAALAREPETEQGTIAHLVIQINGADETTVEPEGW